MDILATVVLAGLACAYLTRIFLLEKKISHEGPFVFKAIFVFFPDTNHVQRFALFDMIRFICGAYKRVPEMGAQQVYTLRDHWIAEIWTCHLCLSFWTALPLSIILSITYHPPLLIQFVMHFAIACISFLLVDYALNREEE